MWMVEPVLLCDRHLLGEHGEIHKHRHNFVKRHSIAGRINPVTQIEPKSMKSRHDDLATEMVRRGMNHNSPYQQPDLDYLPEFQMAAIVDRDLSIKDLSKRCEKCKKRILNIPVS
jgi:hypothetical protein